MKEEFKAAGPSVLKIEDNDEHLDSDALLSNNDDH
jgi:hypothetical protein